MNKKNIIYEGYYIMIQIIIFILIILFLFFLIYNSYQNQESFANKQYKFGILICCYNRPEYLEKTLHSLKQSNLQDAMIYIIDDFSSNEKTTNLIEDLNIPGVEIIKDRNRSNLGIAASIKKGYTFLYPKCKFLTNIDSDVILKHNWLSKLLETYNNAKNEFKSSKCMVSGFNCTSTCDHKIIKKYDTFYLKKSIGGINLFFHKSFLNDITSTLNNSIDSNWDWQICKYCNNNNVKIITTNPSVIQHIGFDGLHSYGKKI